jgi:predicted glycosyltransferase
MKIWIDFANSPHPLIFAPIVRALEERGHEVAFTARDNAQTVELAQERWADVDVVGTASPSARAAKVATLAERVLQLRRWARANRPDVALSHNSYAQIVAAKLAGIHVVTAMDYEHQPANNLAFRLADRVLLPEPLRGLATIARQGARPPKTVFYPGLKEEIYLGDFEPDVAVLARLGIRRSSDQTVVVARTAPSRALYHRLENDLLLEVLCRLGRAPQTVVVVLPRFEEQRRELADLKLPNMLIPDGVVDSRSLMYAADAVIGAGGTMTREAALLGVPTFSVFRGRRAAADDWLECRGALTTLDEAGALPQLSSRREGRASIAKLRERSKRLVGEFVAAVETAAPSGLRSLRSLLRTT